MKTFLVSVSRMTKGKTGYRRNKYQFGWSFFVEEHTIESLIRLAAVDGFSFLAGEFDRKPPAYYGRTDASTPRITENFRQTHIVPLDDDGKAGNAVDFWESDLLFQTYGAGYYHSSSSTPARPRVRPIFELGRPVTASQLYQEARYAFGWFYNRDGQKRIDVIPQIPQVWYGSAHPTEYRILGNVLPLEMLFELVLDPYRRVKAAEAEAERQRAERYQAPSDNEDVNRILGWLAGRRSGDNRNLCLLWAAGQLKRLGESWATVGDNIIQACQANGYFDAYAGNNDAEICRIFGRSKYQ